MSSIVYDLGLSQLPSETGSDTRAGFEGKVLWNNRNIFNLKKNITLQFNIGINYFDNANNNLYTYNRIEIGYFSSKLFFLSIPYRIIIYDENIRQIGFKNAKGVRLATSKSYLGGNYSTGLVLEYVNSEFNNESSDERRSLYMIYNQYNVKKLLLPINGYILGLKSELFGTFLGGEQNYIKSEFEFKYYLKIIDNLVLASRLKYGAITEDPSKYNSNIPNDNYFYLGGSSTLRGWLDPYDYNNYRGGKGRLVVNSELRFDFSKSFGGSIFADYGKLFNLNEKESYNIGWGSYYITTLGPARIDFAYKVYGYGEISKPTIQFSFLNMF